MEEQNSFGLCLRDYKTPEQVGGGQQSEEAEELLRLALTTSSIPHNLRRSGPLLLRVAKGPSLHMHTYSFILIIF